MNQTGTPYVLARELRDIPEEVRAAPAPLVPWFPEPFALRAVDADGDDPATIASWMARPHLVDTWEQDWPVERWHRHLTAQLTGTYSLPCVLSLDFAGVDRPELGVRDVAYVELYRPAKDEIARLYDAGPTDIGFHIATADPELTGKGVISRWIGLLGEAVWDQDPDCRRLLCEPDHRNPRMRRALVKNGWTELGEFDIRPTRRIALHVLPRTPDDAPTLRTGPVTPKTG
ncbi:GNAT family N-acetyltransferase [Nocardia sp. NPDC024068]|uniref:GNAT family N-acetyltransferase n=1 Tax=Nocardia sp. NPDC024068 TaxID=3157197 RepID=UPI0033C44B00